VITPAALSSAMSSGLGAWANEATGTLAPMTIATRCGASGISARIFTPNGRGVPALVCSIAVPSSARVMVAEAIIPSPPASDTAVTSRGPAT
jgi:hypothetical protein